MNKSFFTNFISAIILIIGYFSPLYQTQLIYVGLFALSGAITNWLAVHMLFEKVPGLYGSGIIPARFEDFKKAIKNLMMDQFFTKENLKKFGSSAIDTSKIDMNIAFNRLLEVIKESSFGGMLSMFGGMDALEPLRAPFKEKMADTITEMLSGPKKSITLPQSKIEEIIDLRLSELTPQMVKKIIQDMIRKHLGWLVVWGGVFGGLIGFISSFFI